MSRRSAATLWWQKATIDLASIPPADRTGLLHFRLARLNLTRRRETNANGLLYQTSHTLLLFRLQRAATDQLVS